MDAAPEGGEIASARGNRMVERSRETAPNSRCHARNPPLVIAARPAELLMNRTIRLGRWEVATRLGFQIIGWRFGRGVADDPACRIVT